MTPQNLPKQYLSKALPGLQCLSILQHWWPSWPTGSHSLEVIWCFQHLGFSNKLEWILPTSILCDTLEFQVPSETKAFNSDNSKFKRFNRALNCKNALGCSFWKHQYVEICVILRLSVCSIDRCGHIEIWTWLSLTFTCEIPIEDPRPCVQSLLWTNIQTWIESAVSPSCPRGIGHQTL